MALSIHHSKSILGGHLHLDFECVGRLVPAHDVRGHEGSDLIEEGIERLLGEVAPCAVLTLDDEISLLGAVPLELLEKLVAGDVASHVQYLLIPRPSGTGWLSLRKYFLMMSARTSIRLLESAPPRARISLRMYSSFSLSSLFTFGLARISSTTLATACSTWLSF